MLSLSSLAAALAAGSLLPAVSAWSCPPLGPVLDAPLSPSKNDAVKQAIEVLKAQIDETFGTPGGASAVSIGVKSIHEKQSLFDYHFNPSVKSDVSTDTIDENTIYRVGSVSKFVPALLALQLDLDLDASVLKFLPEFGKNSDDDEVASIQWKDITVRSLMSQISGLPTQS
jgi:CubicO group peptidase (beta-lactamase class C family)